MRYEIESERAGPAWAAIGAPLVGAPLLVLLLAFASPELGVVDELDSPVATEPLDSDTVGAEAARIEAIPGSA